MWLNPSWHKKYALRDNVVEMQWKIFSFICHYYNVHVHMYSTLAWSIIASNNIMIIMQFPYCTCHVNA